MVQVRYIGTGEAFDHRLPNTSLVYEGTATILLDCGYSVPHALWRQRLDPDWLDAIYLTHFHADHCFGLPAVMYRMHQDGRTRPLTLIGGPGSAEAASRVLETGYPGAMTKLGYDVPRLEIAPGAPQAFMGVTIATARSGHSIPNHSVRLEAEGLSVCYSGDGTPTPATRALYRGATLLIHETYEPDAPSKGHAAIPQVVAMAEAVGVETLHCLHLRRSATAPPQIHVPTPGEVHALGGAADS